MEFLRPIMAAYTLFLGIKILVMPSANNSNKRNLSDMACWPVRVVFSIHLEVGDGDQLLPPH